MPASGNARISRFVRQSALTGCPAQPSSLTATTNRIVPAQTSEFDHRCDTVNTFLVSDPASYEPLALVLLDRVDRQLDGGLVATAVELALLDRRDAHELAVLHLQADEADAALLSTD